MNQDKTFALINSINPVDPLSWENKLFLTFDIDWAHDAVIEDMLELCSEYSVPITIFATHDTHVLNSNNVRMRNVEIGLHPNFNSLLKNESLDLDFRSVCSKLKEKFPTASSVRSHSLCFGSLIQTAYEELGLTHDSSVIVPYQQNTHPLVPWRMWDGLIRVPYLFCDYVTAMTTDAKMHELACRAGLRVFDFHPIHIFLNTEKLSRYEHTRPLHHNPKELIKHRYEGYGTRNRLIELLELGRKS